MRWVRGVCSLLLLLAGMNASAAIPSVLGWQYPNGSGSYTGQPMFPSAEEACAAGFATKTGWVFNLADGASPTLKTCRGSAPGFTGNNNSLMQVQRTNTAVCPANSTMSGGTCSCSAGYEQNAAGNACVPAKTEAEKFCQSMIGHTINTGGSGSIPAASCHMPEPPFDAPEQGKGCGVTIGDAVKFPNAEGNPIWSGVGKFGGGICTPGASPGLPPVESKDDKCPGGFVGTVNGVEKCIAAEPDKGIEGVKSGSSTDASGTKKDVKEETKCEGQKCTTTTTTTTTTSSGSVTVTTDKKEESITDKCQKDPTNKLCQKTNGGFGQAASEASCQTNPSAKGCGGEGAAVGDLYAGKGVTVQSILDQAVTDLKGSGIGGAVGGFFTVSGGGSCPPLVWNVSYVNATVSLPSLCSDTANTIYAVLQGVLLVVAGFVAFRVAIDN